MIIESNFKDSGSHSDTAIRSILIEKLTDEMILRTLGLRLIRKGFYTNMGAVSGGE